MLRTFIPLTPYTKLIAEEPAIKILFPEPLDGNITLFELTIICKLIKAFDIKRVFEIGTFNGRTTLNIATNISSDAKVLTLDLPKNKSTQTKLTINPKDKSGWSDLTYIKQNVTGLFFKNRPEAKKITQLLGDSTSFDFTPYEGNMDFVFVDGSHTAAYVQSDTEHAYKIIRKGGCIVWHDYGVWHDVTKVLNNFYKNDSRLKKMKHIAGTTMVIQVFK